ncbi:MAG TPA: kelch repeat-containing protein [Terriglobales bacterium]|nr:kelch repeat-containing protein [Terriglobales bacterium]
MGNGNFQKGTWNQLPSNCSRNYTLTYTRCAQWGTMAVTECVSWVVNAFLSCVQWAAQAVLTCVAWANQVSQECTSWASQASQNCCTWWPCSWGCAIVTTIISWVCEAFAIVVTVVCAVFAFVIIVFCALFMIIVTIACALWAVLVYIFCLFWSVISIIFCVSNMSGGTAFLLTDGTVMIQECVSVYGEALPTRRWWKLSPDDTGSYVNGSWSRLADSHVGRRYFASGVLADGRLVVCGGEYSDASGSVQNDDSNTCEIYDPTTNAWSTFAAPMTSGNSPATWDKIGDAPCAVLPDGTFLMGSIDTPNIAKLDPTTLTWTAMNQRPVVGSSSEESWVLMPDDTIAAPSCSDPPTTWVYDIATDHWNQDNNLPTSIVLPPPGDVAEIGPGLLTYGGTAFFLGGNQHTAIYAASATPQWTNGSDLPAQNSQNIGIMDGPAAILVDGNILFGAGPIDAQGDYESPCFYFEFDGTNFNRTNDPPNNGCPTFVTRLLLLPNGDVMFCREDDSSFYAYHPAAASPQTSFQPVIQNCPANLAAGSMVQISGTQFNGLSQAVAYGDDAEAATNYPLVRVTNQSNNQERYCRTSNHTTTDASGNTVPSMGVATGVAVVTTNVAIPGDLPVGTYSLVVVANGIPSLPFAVTVSKGTR